MRYMNINDDNSIGVWSVVPKTVKEISSGAILTVLGVRRRTGACILYGGWSDNRQIDIELVVGDENFDIAELEVDSLEGYIIEFPDFVNDILAKLPDEHKNKVVRHRKMEWREELGDNEFRGAWRDGGNKIDIDMPIATEITKDRLRKQREPKLAALDVEFMQAVEQDDKKKQKEIAAKKQKLRDITKHPKLEAAITPEDLKSITVEEE